MAPVNFESLAKTAFTSVKNVLGTEVIYTPKTGGIFNIRGVFDDRGEEIDPDSERLISTNAFTLGIKFADLPKLPVKGDRVQIQGVKYQVINILEDGALDASTVLHLHKEC